MFCDYKGGQCDTTFGWCATDKKQGGRATEKGFQMNGAYNRRSQGWANSLLGKAVSEDAAVLLFPLGSSCGLVWLRYRRSGRESAPRRPKLCNNSTCSRSCLVLSGGSGVARCALAGGRLVCWKNLDMRIDYDRSSPDPDVRQLHPFLFTQVCESSRGQSLWQAASVSYCWPWVGLRVHDERRSLDVGNGE